MNNINSLTLNKQYPLYGYTNTDTFASKGVEVISSGTGNMYMVAYDGEAENSNVVLMVFRPGMPII